MKTTIKRHRRRMTKHGKGMTKPRKSNRRIKNRKHKTRRQSAGGLVFGWDSFINANDNPVNPPITQTYADQLKIAMLRQKGKSGIDVKVKLENGKPLWLIGNKDTTFKQLRDGAKDERYQTFIEALLQRYPEFNRFETDKGDRDSSKGIILTDAEFCEMFINNPFVLDYPRLRDNFALSRFACTPSASAAAPSSAAPPPSAAPSSAAPSSAAPPPSVAVRPFGSAAFTAPTQRQPDFSASSDTSFFMPLAPLQQQPVTTEYFKKLQEIKKMGLNVKDQLIAQVLNNTEGNIKDAVAILRAAADSGQSSAGTSAAPGARGGPMLPIQERATIYDFLKAQDGILPPILGGGECPNYTQALYEINAGQKKTCWIWYIIPSSPGRSDISIFFGIGPNANRANVTPEQYLSNWKLSIRYIKILNAIGAKLQQSNPSNVKQFLVTLMGSEIDYDKLKKSLIIFSNALKNQHKVTPEIALLAEFLGVKLYAQPPGPPPGASAAHMSAAPMSAAPMSAAFRSPEQVFPVRNLSFKPTIADLMFPDEFVEKYAKEYGIQFDQTETYNQDKHRTLRNFTTACPDVTNWTVMYTIGDMNCLTHAFLQCMSSMYRKIHVTNPEIQEEKTAVARAFRLAFADMKPKPDILHHTAEKDLLNKDGMADLGEDTFASYARLFGVILVVFDFRTQVIVSNLTKVTAIQTMPVIFMHGDGGHFSSVLPSIHSGPNPFVITYEHAKQIGCLTVPLTFPNELALNE